MMSTLATDIATFEKTFETYLNDLAQKSLEASSENLPSFMDHYIQAQSPDLRKRIEEEFFGLGPLRPLLDDTEVNEVMINNYQSVHYEKQGRLCAWTDHFVSEKSYGNFISRFAIENKINPNLENPVSNGKWLSWRFHLVVKPLCKEPVLTLRRHQKKNWTLSQLESQQWAPPEEIERLRNWALNKVSFLIVGPTSSGKTSFMSAVLHELPVNERMVIIEDTDELPTPNPCSVKLLTRGKGSGLSPIDQGDLVYESLRMRPDRIVMGEMRGGEAKDFLMALSTGHRGSVATLHAQCPHQALSRLEFLIQMGAPYWRSETIRHLIWLGVEGLVVLDNTNGKRRLGGIYKVASLEPSGFCLDTLYKA